MSYASLIQIPEGLRSSTSVAALASLGIHGLLWAVLPILPLDSTLDTQLRTVGLVELTPQEQSRLPQASSGVVPPPTLPPFATQQSALPPIPPAPPSFPVGALPPMPPNGAIAALPPPGIQSLPNNFRTSLPQTQTFRIAPPAQNPNSTITISPSTSAIAPYEDTPVINPAPNTTALVPYTTPRLNTLPPPPPTTNILPPPPPTTTLPSLPTVKPPVSVIPPQNRQAYNSSERLPSPPVWRQPKVSGLPANRLQPAAPFSPQDLPPPPPIPAAQTPQQLALSPQPQPASALPQPRLPERGKQELLVRQQQIRRARNYVVPTTQPPSRRQKVLARQQSPALSKPTVATGRSQLPERGKQELLALQQKYRTRAANPVTTPTAPSREIVAALRQQTSTRRQPTTANTTTEKIAQLQAWSARQNKVQRSHANVVTKAPIYKTFKSCDRTMQGVAVVGVVVNPEGKIVSGPDFLSKQGAAKVEQAAQAYVRQYRFLKGRNPINQQFNLQYKYDTANCAQPTQTPADPRGQESQTS